MKFFAVLKDCFREAADNKVLYVMVAISLIVILLVGSISFSPLSGEEAIKGVVAEFAPLSIFPNPNDPRGYKALEVLQLNDATEPYRGEYRATVELYSRRAGVPIASNPPVISAFLKDQFELHDFQVLGVTPSPDKVNTFDVQVQGPGVGRNWRHRAWLFFGGVEWFVRADPAVSVYTIENSLVNTVGGMFSILVSVVITAFFIPNMLHKGTIDLLLAKPIGRVPLLIYKYLGGLTFMFLNTAVAVVGVWLVLGLRTGIWSPGFLLSVPALTYFFAILYSISTLISVLTRSAVISILFTCFMWIVFMGAGQTLVTLEMLRADGKDIPQWAMTSAKILNKVTPRWTDLDILTSKFVTDSVLSENEKRRNHIDKFPEFTWIETFAVSGLFIAVMLGLACWRFWARDY